jgi:hypothetical protein
MIAKDAHRFTSSIVALVGLALIFVGVRVFAGLDSESTALNGLGSGLLLVSLLMRYKSAQTENAEAACIRKWMSLCLLGLLASMGMLLLEVYVFDGESDKSIKMLLSVGWPIVMTCSLPALVAMETSMIATAKTAHCERRRIKHALERGLAFGLLLSVVFVSNYLASRHELKTDLSHGKKAEATESTKGIVRDLSDTVEVTLFYPKANDVAEVLKRYFDSLSDLSSELTVKTLDHALASQMASEAGVSENGYVVVVRDKRKEKIRVGKKLNSARTALRKFDANFAKALIKVSREKSTAYFTIGHGERSMNPLSSDKRSPVRLLKQQLQANQYVVKPLGIAEGLGHSVPKDASLVFILGPEKEFLPEEVDALRDAIKRGVRLLIALEAEREGQPLDEILGMLGLKFEKTILANERGFVRVTGTNADRNFLYSNRYSSHASVTTMTRHSNKLATLFARSGYLMKLDKTPKGMRVDVVLRSLDESFADLNNNLKFDSDSEQKKSYDLAAAVTKTSTHGSSRETRAFVFSDVDTFSDKYVKYQGNPYLLGDIIYWLRDAKEPVLPTVSEADVRIVHKRDEDTWWFYSTTMGVPLTVMGLGLILGRRRRRS